MRNGDASHLPFVRHHVTSLYASQIVTARRQRDAGALDGMRTLQKAVEVGQKHPGTLQHCGRLEVPPAHRPLIFHDFGSPTSPTNHPPFLWNCPCLFGDPGKPGDSQAFPLDLRSGRRETGYGYRYFGVRSGTSKFSMQNSDGSLRADLIQIRFGRIRDSIRLTIISSSPTFPPSIF